MKIYGFVGTPCWDLIIYLGVLLHDVGQKVLVVDHSKDQEIMNCIEKPLEMEGVIHWNQVDFVGDSFISLEYLEEYDTVLWLCYSAKEDLSALAVETWIGVTDNRRKNMENIWNVLENKSTLGNLALDTEKGVHLVIRDIIDKKLGVGYFQTGAEDISFIPHELYFDEIDYSCRIQLEHHNVGSFLALSKDMERFLIQILNEISQFPIKSIREAYKRGKRRRMV